MDFETWEGTQGEACVVGSDSDIGLALLKPLTDLPHPPDFLALSREAASSGDQLRLFQHDGPQLQTEDVRVNGLTTFDNEYDYFRIEGDWVDDGAVLTNERGELQGIRMSGNWQHQEADEGEEAYVIDAPRVATTALPLLRSGHKYLLWSWWWWSSTSASPGFLSGTVQGALAVGGVSAPMGSILHHSLGFLPVIFHGELTVDGAPAPKDSILYARVRKEGQPDHWTADQAYEAGYYVLNVDAPPNIYAGGTIEFWMDCRRASVTAVYDQPEGSAVELDLAF